jgi:uncharacterized protein YdeI (YjbR/CyaY-like superfamily)
MVRIPFDVAPVWGTRGHLRVKGEINGAPFRGALFPTRMGYHAMLVNKKMQAAGRTGEGATAKFRIEPDREERIPTTPPELERVLSEDRALRRWYNGLSQYVRWEIGRHISEPKSAEARARRAEQMAERLLATMEGERELPPVLRLAFARYPQALEGWKRMTDAQRRGHLLGIFYYRTPEAQARRVAKVVQEAARFGRKEV